MAETKETFKVKDLTETVKGLTGLVKENYLNGVELALSVWAENLKVLDNQVDQLFNFQQEYIKAGKEFQKKLPKEAGTFLDGNSKVIDEFDRLVTFQKDYVKSVRSISDKFRKETVNLTQKNVEKAFSLVDDYLNLFKA
ncbi:MAG: hypothetical protein HYW01_13880 [Deltaproteobacteria bacterium]|nr:hypothetical protein [Deltaproteobacteria bacterium]